MFLFHFSEDGFPSPLVFDHPIQTWIVHQAEDIEFALNEIDRAVQEGYYAAGFLTYEAAAAYFPDCHLHRGKPGLPLLMFGIFEKPMMIGASDPVFDPGPNESSLPVHVPDAEAWLPSVSKETFASHIDHILKAIARGETDQVNYTFRLHTTFSGDPLKLYHRLRLAQKANYSAYLDMGRFKIMSVSPELFFRKKGSDIFVRPMKGTIARGRTFAEDREQARRLLGSAKDQAENKMIADLMRFELSRISEAGTVQVERYCDLEPYPTVWQLTSTIKGVLRQGTSLNDVFAALFPSASITGRPKDKVLNLITDLEPDPRGLYCGAIGYLQPNGDALFNIAIRTATLDTETGRLEYGVGGGITSASTVDGEYEEAMAKAKVWSAKRPDFRLLETMLLDEEGFFLLERHLQRLSESASYFGIPIRLTEIRAALESHRVALEQRGATGPARVRLLIDQRGHAEIESSPVQRRPAHEVMRVALAKDPIDSKEIFLYHKTTYRDMLNARREPYPDAFDVLLWNERGELTEFTIGNVVVQLEGVKWTPPIECGLLAGTFREELLAQRIIRERVLTKEDLMHAEGVWLINSVQRWVPVVVA